MISKAFRLLSLLILSGIWFCTSQTNRDHSAPPNILFIIIDDMNVDISCYGGPILTPNIDRLAESGMRFNRGYVQQPVCAASRASFLTGLRPNTTGVDYPYSYYFLEEVLPKYGTIARFFDRHGYQVKQFGKVHHNLEGEFAAYRPKHSGKYVSDSLNTCVKKYGGATQPPFERTYKGVKRYVDFKVADSAARALKQVESDRPFFFAAGLKKPHLPFSAPDTFWNLYQPQTIALPLPLNLADGAPAYAVDRYYLDQYRWEHHHSNMPFSPGYSRMIRQAYYASSSFVDSQVGRILDALHQTGLQKNTIVLLISDHGFLLGEQNYWGKTNLFDKGLRIPFMVSWPGMIAANSESNALIEAVDIYPSLVDLAGFEPPAYLEGTSFKPVLSDPERDWKKGVFSQQPRGWVAETEGVSLRTDRYRYTEWQRRIDGAVMARELYDYTTDPAETVNLADHPEYEKIQKELSMMLHNGWKTMLPEGIGNDSQNPIAPPSYAWGPEGVARRQAWHKMFGGNEEEGWKVATLRRAKFEQTHETQ